jgi:DNA-binding response OmpR family regulator
VGVVDTSIIPNTAALRGLRVLIVEDTPAVAGALRYLLEDLGLVVVGPAATLSAAEDLLAVRPHAAVVDMHLQGETGFAFVQRLRAINVPVLAISGSVLASNPSFATLQKPFSGDQFLAAVCRLVGVT